MKTAFFIFFAFVGCSIPLQETIHYERPADGGDWAIVDGAHCWRCNTLWGDEDAAYCEWHKRELNMMMYASGCKKCRHHGAYKDMKMPEGSLPTPPPPPPPH